MTDIDAETRRREVAQLLDQGLDYKLLRGGSREAMRLLRKARDLSLKPTPLWWPWPQLTAYRLAYLMMRDARNEKDVRNVLQLLDEASDAKTWPDPLQHAFLCAVLIRLLAFAKGQARQELQRRIAGALVSMGHASPYGSGHGPVQTETLNIAELLTFASGADYHLEGLGRLSRSHLPLEGALGFSLVGSHGVDSKHRDDRDFRTR